MKQEIQLLQAMINVSSGSKLQVDGIIGQETRGAWSLMDAIARGQIRGAASSFGVRIDSLLNEDVAISPKAAVLGWVTMSDLTDMMYRVAMRTDVSLEFLQELVDVEAEKRIVNGIVHYNPNSRMGQFRGLTQMGKAAWQDATEWLTRKGESLPDYEESAFSPEFSLLAAAAYNSRYAKSLYGDRPTFAERYTLHNQGPNWVRNLRQNKGLINVAGQSPLAQRLIVDARRSVGV